MSKATELVDEHIKELEEARKRLNTLTLLGLKEVTAKVEVQDYSEEIIEISKELPVAVSLDNCLGDIISRTKELREQLDEN